MEDSRVNNKQPELYSIIYPEKLSSPLQISLAKVLQGKIDGNFTLALFVESSFSSFFSISANNPPLLAPSLSLVVLQQALEKHLASNKATAEVFTSTVTGAGKTHTIHQKLRSSDVSRVLYTSTDFAQLIYELNNTNCSTIHFSIPSPASFGAQHTLLHWEDVDRFLFRLFVLGIVEDQYNNIFYLRFDSTFLIEVSNGLSSNSHPLGSTFLYLLPQHLVEIPKKIQLTPEKLQPFNSLFGVSSYSEMLPQIHHPIDAVIGLQFFATTSTLLQGSPGFVRQSDTIKKNTKQQLISFVTKYLTSQERKRIYGVNQPLITFGLDKASKYRVISTSVAPGINQLHLPHFDLANQPATYLHNFLQVLFPKGFSVDPHFVLTSDNTFKLALLKTLVSCEIPVIFMGETGSGKTKLVEYFGKVYAVPVFTLDLHGGIGEQDIVAFVNRVQAQTGNADNAILFFDEINVSPAVELMKELICDHSCRGVPLARNFQVVAACNPYVEIPPTSDLTPTTSQATLATNSHTINLRYNVRPLPATLEKYVWDFGAISSDTELEYICSCLFVYLHYFDVASIFKLSQKSFQQISW